MPLGIYQQRFIMNSVQEIISKSALFHDLPEDYIKEITTISVEKTYTKDENIFLEGDDGNGFYLVADGRVKVYKVSPDGKEKILHFLECGEPFGEVAVFSGKTFPANATAITKVRLIFFPRQSFVNLISRNPSLSLNMMAVLSKRLKQFAVQIEGLALKDVPGRLAGYLLYLSLEQKNNQKINLIITKGQLASLLGTIPETLSRILNKMSNQGLIEVNGRFIDILNPSALKHLASTGKFSDE